MPLGLRSVDEEVCLDRLGWIDKPRTESTDHVDRDARCRPWRSFVVTNSIVDDAARTDDDQCRFGCTKDRRI